MAHKSKNSNTEEKLRNQRIVHRFFVDHLNSQEAFTKAELEQHTDWQGGSFSTYWSKQLKPFVHEVGPGKYRVVESFRPFLTWKRFRQHVTQVRRFSDYVHTSFDHVLVYEFFMPLTNEAALRSVLDALFYKDTITSRLRTVNQDQLRQRFPRSDDEAERDYLERACETISNYFVGYSISHVSGRFLAEKIATMTEAAELQARGERYLLDETTAVARFIFPCKDQHEAELVEWFFRVLFTESIIQVVNGESEIWMIESGLRNRVHIWSIEEDA